MPRKRNKNGVYLTEVGTDTAKEQIYNRFTLVAEGDEPLAGRFTSLTTLKFMI
jgi:phage terminase large subunit GpA-like protein